MESLDKIIGIVERIQWIHLQKLAVSISNIAVFPHGYCLLCHHEIEKRTFSLVIYTQKTWHKSRLNITFQ
jgi:hypothetical protein